MANVKATDLINFTRLSEGYALAKVSYGEELVENGDFATDSDWTLQRVSISGGVADFSDNSSGPARVIQDNVYTVGKTYLVTFDVNTSGTLRVYDGSSYDGDIAVSSGTVSKVIYAEGTQFIIRANVTNDYTGTIDNVSVKEVLFNQTDGTLQLFPHPDNIPRIEYDADGNLLGLLIEEQRTNNITNSESCSFVDKSGGTVTASTTPAPYGTSSTVKRIQSSTLNGGGRLQVTILTGGDNYCSVYVRSRTGADQNLKITAAGTTGATQVAPASGDWVRLGRVASLGAGSRDMRVLSTGDTIDLDIALPQVELGSFPTSYIKTTGSTASRSADVAKIDVDQFGYNQGKGTVFAEANPIPVGSGYGLKVILNLSNGTDNDEIFLLNENNDRLRLILDPTGASNDVDFTISGAEGSLKYAAAWELNNVNAAHGGVLGAGDTSATPIQNATTMTISSTFTQNAKFSGHIKSIKYFPKRLSNAKLQELTS